MSNLGPRFPDPPEILGWVVLFVGAVALIVLTVSVIVEHVAIK